MLTLAYVVDFFADELAGRGGRGLTFASGPACPLNGLLLRHDPS
jgi:hypothetical protein